MEDAILQSVKNTESFLDDIIDKDQRALATSISSLENKVIRDLRNTLSTDRGRLVSPRVNLNQSQQVHKDLTRIFDETYGDAIRNTVNGYDEAADFIQKNYTSLGESMKFTGVDKKMIDVLKSSSYDQYAQFGKNAQERIAQAMYSHIGARSSLQELENQISGILTGRLSRNGRPMEQYTNLWANDGIMNFHNQVNVKKGKDLGMKYFLYYGNIMLTSRPFCKLRAGKVYSEDEINSWTFTWSGKSGPAMTHRGGWNCRHHWQPVRKNWIPDGEISVESVYPYEDDPGRAVLGKVKREAGTAHVVRPSNPSLPSPELSKMHTEVSAMGDSIEEKEIRTAVNDGADTRLVAYRDETGKLLGASSYRIDPQNSCLWINHLGALDDLSRNELLLKVKAAAEVDGMSSVRVQAPQFKRMKKWWRARGFGLKRGEIFMHSPVGRIKIPAEEIAGRTAAAGPQTSLSPVQKTQFRKEEEALFKIKEEGDQIIKSIKEGKYGKKVNWDLLDKRNKEFWQWKQGDLAHMYNDWYRAEYNLPAKISEAYAFAESSPEWKKIEKLQKQYVKQVKKVIDSKVWTTVSMKPAKSSTEANILLKQIKQDYADFRSYAEKYGDFSKFDLPKMRAVLDLVGTEDIDYQLKAIFAEKAIQLQRISKYQRYNFLNTLSETDYLNEKMEAAKKIINEGSAQYLQAKGAEYLKDAQRVAFLATYNVPIDLLEDMTDYGYRIKFIDQVGRAMFRHSKSEAIIYRGDGFDIAAHEWGHAIDHFFSDRITTGGRWKDFELTQKYSFKELGKQYQREYKALHTTSRGLYDNGDGEYWKGRFLDDYEGRIYNHLGGDSGPEWFSMNMQRYSAQNVTVDYFAGKFSSVKYLGEDYGLKINSQIANVQFAGRDWTRVQKAYPWMYDFITQNFSKRFLNYTF